MAHESTGAIYAAAGANLAIAAAKFVGGALTGSTAMLAEGVHSVVDTANQVLLLVGMKRAGRPAASPPPVGEGRGVKIKTIMGGQ
ncbi:cation transporter, partial [Methylobacterium fujisawaense]|uniref:cation transporter n=1 Tax=Methylobacterium fujisawaense TaxID=107400 RepID=UPI00313DF095